MIIKYQQLSHDEIAPSVTLPENTSTKYLYSQRSNKHTGAIQI